jgi:uncharacterized protein YndB with AHSA1/START domain
MSLVSCEADVRVGGRYRFVFGHNNAIVFEAFGRYIEVTPHSRLVWTNDEGRDGGALDGALASGAAGGMNETLEQLDELLVTLGASVGRS